MANIALMWNWSYSMDSELLKKLSKEIQDLKSEVMELRRRPLPLGGGTDEDAIHDNVSGEIAAIAEKTSIADDDLILVEDSAALYSKKKVLFSRIKAAMNALFAPIGHVGATGSAHGNATTGVAGFMSAADKTKLNSLNIAWTNFTPVVSGYLSMTVSLHTNSFCKYKLQGDELSIAFLLRVTTGGTASRGIYVNVPVSMTTTNAQSMTAMVFSAGTDWYPGVCFALDNGKLDIRRPGAVNWGLGTTYIALNATFFTAGV